MVQSSKIGHTGYGDYLVIYGCNLPYGPRIQEPDAVHLHIIIAMGDSTEHKRYIVRFPAEHEKDVLEYLKKAFKDNKLVILVKDDKYRKKLAEGSAMKEVKDAVVSLDVNPGKVFGGKSSSGSYSNELHGMEFISIEGDLTPEQEDIVRTIVREAPKFTSEDQTAMAEKKWYAVRTAGGKEEEAKKLLEKEISLRHLEDSIEQVLIPTEKVFEMKNGKRVQTEKNFYPGYILVKANMAPEIQGVIRELPDVAGVLSNKGKSFTDHVPIPLRESEVSRLLGQVDGLVEDQEVGNEVPFILNEPVKITDGPFNGFNGTIDAILEDKKKVKVIVIIFGRKTVLELNYAQVTKE
jgi:transcriptional antiterminator NusG